MKQLIRNWLITLLLSGTFAAIAQQEERPLRIFGYFQNQFVHTSGARNNDTRATSFSLQQLNLFFQKNLAKDWSAFVNFEFINSFSSSRKWGAVNLEEAWGKYRLSRQVNFKFGLLTPEFNNLNIIKNRMPLLPYVVRPMAYESSFEEFVAIEEFVPRQAFLQVYGFIPSGKAKIDHAFYIGNSPNINNNPANGQTGIDTTDAFLVGGRIGVRYQDFKIGVSGTYENVNLFGNLSNNFPMEFAPQDKRPRYRFGADVSFQNNYFLLEAEYIDVMYDEGNGIDVDKTFGYSTLGFCIAENWLVYGTYWYSKEFFPVSTGAAQDEIENLSSRVKVWGPGLAWQLQDRIKVKAQYAHVTVKVDEAFNNPFRGETAYFSAAISVFF